MRLFFLDLGQTLFSPILICETLKYMNVKAETPLALKKPYLVYVLAICFMLAPFGNLIIALYSSGIPQWYSPVIWWKLFVSQSVADMIILSSILLAGCALTIQKKSSWFIAVAVLLIVTINNLFFMETAPDQALSPWYVPLILNTPILVVLFFFRYPYLDKRDHILSGTHNRFIVEFPVLFPEWKLEGKMESLSKSGCFVVSDTDLTEKAEAGDVIDMTWESLPVKATVVYAKQKGLGLRFQKPSGDFKAKIREVIKSADKEPDE